VIAIARYAQREGCALEKVADLSATVAPFALLTGRIGNFINGELWGKPTELPWAVMFRVGDTLRHPSQLYEALLEGALLLVILNWIARKPRAPSLLSGTFLVFYSLIRFAIEFLRVPDVQIGYLAWNWLTEGQLLCVPTFAAGWLLLHRARSHRVRSAVRA
jgi:phosphatidylglycerol:prolipoprotein diacylglycerol transferase